MKKILFIFGLLLCLSSFAHATACGTTSVSSTGVVDADGFTWSNGTYFASLVLPPQISSASLMACTTAGGTFNFTYSGNLSSTGTFTQTLPKNTLLTPPGSTWAITVCPNARAGCITYTTTITGTTQDITTALNAAAVGPRFQYSAGAYGYDPVELITTVNSGMLFYNTTLGTLQVYNSNALGVGLGGWQTNSTNSLASTLQDEFCGHTPATTKTLGNLGWDITVLVAGTNPVAAIASVANHPCLITLTTNTTATNGVGITLGPAVGVIFPGASTNWSSEQIVKVNQIATGDYRVGFGTVDTATAIPTNGIYFRFSNTLTDTAIEACSDSTGTETCTATTVAPTAGDYVDFYMSSTVTGAVTFTVVDITTPATSTVTLCPTGCTAAATVPTVVLSPMFNIAETGSSAVDVLTVDYFTYQQAVVR